MEGSITMVPRLHIHIQNVSVDIYSYKKVFPVRLHVILIHFMEEFSSSNLKTLSFFFVENCFQKYIFKN